MSNEKKQKKPKKNIKKGDERILVVIIIVFVVTIVTICAKYFVFDRISKEKTEGNYIEIADKENTKSDYTNRFDMNNTENVKIEENKKVNISNNFKEEKQFSGLKITDAKLESDANTGVTTFRAMAENMADTQFTERNITIILLDKDENEINRLDGYIDTIQPTGKTEIVSYSTTDISNAYDFKIEI